MSASVDRAVTSNVRSGVKPNLAEALVAAQNALPGVRADTENPHFHSRFVSLDALINATRSILNQHGLAITQFPEVADTGQPTLRTTITHVSGESVSHVMPLFLQKQDMQGLGSAITYARRYAWAAALGIAGEEDDDGEGAGREPRAGAATRSGPAAANSGPSRPDEPKPKPASAGQKKKLDVLVGTLRSQGHITTADVYRNIGYDPVPGADGELHWSDLREQLTAADAHLLIDMLERFQESVRDPGETSLPLPHQVRESMK